MQSQKRHSGRQVKPRRDELPPTSEPHVVLHKLKMKEATTPAIKRIKEIAARKLISKMVGELKAGGYELIVLAVCRENDVQIQHTTDLATSFLNGTPFNISQFAKFCKKEAKEKTADRRMLATTSGTPVSKRSQQTMNDSEIEVNSSLFIKEQTQHTRDEEEGVASAAEKVLEDNNQMEIVHEETAFNDDDTDVEGNDVDYSMNSYKDEEFVLVKQEVANEEAGASVANGNQNINDEIMISATAHDNIDCTAKAPKKQRLIDYLQNDLNKRNRGYRALTKSSPIADQLTSGLDEIKDYAKKTVLFYRRMDRLVDRGLAEGCTVTSPLSQKPFTEISTLEAHVKRVREKLDEECVETCSECRVVLPAEYMAHHPCTQTDLPNRIKYGYSDIRDLVAYVEMHMVRQRVSDGLQCHICGLQQSDVSAYRKHFVENHILIFICGCIEKVCYSKEEAAKHTQPLAVLDPHSEEPMYCNACQQIFTSHDELVNHLQSEHDWNTELTCKDCFRCYSCKYQQDNHKCTKLGWYICGFEGCEERFPKYRQVLTHRHDTHGVLRYLCNLCGAKFLINSALRSHQEWVHHMGKPIDCKVCGKTYRGINTLRQHMQSHAEEPRYKCKQCDMAYKLRSSLSRHITSCHPVNGQKRMYTCLVCQASYRKKSSLDHHLVTAEHATVTQTAKVSKCPHCGKLFGTREKMRTHEENVHIRSKKNTCQYCGKSFSDKSNLRQHVLAHTGERPCCSICKQVFRSKPKLSNHMMDAHQIQVPYSKYDRPAEQRHGNVESRTAASVLDQPMTSSYQHMETQI